MAGSDAEGLFQRLVENIPGIVAYLDLVQLDDPGRSVPIYISPQIEGLLGYPPEAWLTDDELWLDVLHPDDRSRMIEADERARRTLSSLFAEYRMIARDGRVVWVSENAAVVKDDVSGAVYWQGVMVDVTERKAAETYRERSHSTLRRKNALLRESDRLKDELISVVSHDLRTPLTSIMGYLELVLDESEGPLTPEQRGFLEVIERNANRLLVLVNDLLFISRANAGKLELDLSGADLGTVAAEVVEAQRPQADEFEVELRLACESVCATVDRARIAELLENLVSNALKFTPAEGSVEVRVSHGDGLAILEVADTGVGISASDRAHLFERFFRSRGARNVPGVGLGLSIVKAIVDAHGGRIAVTSDAGTGTTFHVEVPLEGAGRAARRSGVEGLSGGRR